MYPFRKEDRKAIEKGFMYGLYDAVGKSGWYAFYKMKFGGEYDEKIGSGRSIEAYTIYTYIKNSKEKKLILSSHGLTAAHASAIAKALETNTTLSKLDLYGNNIGGEGATAIAKALETNTTLSELYLGNNNIGDEAETVLRNIETHKREGTNGYKKVEGFIIYIV